jgi:tetratricopeptide (TPR) repeat protein
MHPHRRPMYLLLLLVLFCLPSRATLIMQAQSASPEYEDSMEKARHFMDSGKDEEAVREYKNAVKLSDGKQWEAYLGLAKAYYRLKAEKNVLDTCQKILEIAPDDHARAEAYNIGGVAILQSSEGDKGRLAKAESSIRKALEFDPHLQVCHYNLGRVLLAESRDDEGIAELKAYLAARPDGVDAKAAEKYLANPVCAREQCAPEFSFTSANGEYISSDDLRGKIVVVDFWATWCGPCKDAFPALRYINKRSDKDKVVLISISEDADEGAWHAFLEKNHPEWIEVRDKNAKLRRLLDPGGSSIPTYLVIDGDGIVRRKYTGWSGQQDGQIEDDIKKWSKTIHVNSEATPPKSK